jgi:Flp pilus assembly protein TadG
MMSSTFQQQPARQVWPRQQKGAVAVTTALALVALIGAGAFAIDFAHAFVVRNELQNSADASALAGASCLFSKADCANVGLAQPTWDSARNKAAFYLQYNKAENRTLATADVQAGYWNLSTSVFSAAPLTPGWVQSTNDVPAVQVTIPLDTSSNGGGATTFLARIFGYNDVPLSTRAVAVVSPPQGVSPGGLTPFVLSKCLFDRYWNAATNEPLVADRRTDIVVGPGNQQDVTITTRAGETFRFPAVSEYVFKGSSCDSGQWTTFSLDSNSANDVRQLINEGNPTPLAVGDPTYIANGNMASMYQEVHRCSAAGTRACQYSVVPVVDDSSKTGTEQAIVAFACVQVLSASWSGRVKYIEMQLSADTSQCHVSGNPGGPNLGAVVPPRLAL